MTDLSLTIAPKSDQLNSDDLIGGPRTITITKVSACPDSAEQPIAVSFEGDGGKPYKPCKSMRRVFVHVWGRDGNSYVGRRLTIYRDDKVQFGGLAVGGIRISHMSHIDKDVTLALTATRANRKPYTVKPLLDAPKKLTTGEWLDALQRDFDGAEGDAEAVDAILGREDVLKARKALQNGARDRLNTMVKAALDRTRAPDAEMPEQEGLMT